MLEFLRSLVLIQETQHTQGNQGNQGAQEDQPIQERQGNQHFKTGNQCWFKGYCAQFKSPARMSLYQGVIQCQITLLLEQLAGVSHAFNAMPSQRELASSAEPLHQRERQNAGFMVGHQLAPKPNEADSVAQQRELKRERTRARHESSELRVCVGFVH